MRIPLSRRASSSTPGAPIDWASHRQSRASVERRFGGFTAPLRKREHRTESNGPRWRPIPSSKKRTNTPTSPRINLSDSFVKNPAGPLDSQFSATFSFGTPPQQANLMIDLGSSDMWVASDCQTNCPAGASYNPNASSTSRANGDFSVSYAGAPPQSGKLVTDVVSIGGLVVSNQQFGAASSLTYDWAKSEISGIIGLAFPSGSQTGATPFFQNLIAQNSLRAPIMGLAIGRARSGTQADSELNLGGADRARYHGGVAWLPLIPSPLWTVAFAGFVTKNGTMSSSAPVAFLDTGAAAIVMPSSDAAALFAMIPSVTPVEGQPGYYKFPCANKPEISVQFAGIAIPISRDDIGVDQLPGNFCLSSIVGSDVVQGFSVLGLAFLKNTYTILDAGSSRVGFATPNY